MLYRQIKQMLETVLEEFITFPTVITTFLIFIAPYISIKYSISG